MRAITEPAAAHTPTAPPIEPRLASHTAHLARLAAQRTEDAAQQALPDGRTPRDLALLSALADEPLSQARLGTLLEINRTVMISVIDALETSGLVARERDPADRRRYALRLTGQGRATLPATRAAVTAAERRITDPHGGSATQQRLHQLLRPLLPDLHPGLPGTVTGLTSFLLGRAAWRLRTQREHALLALGIQPRCVRALTALDATQPCTQERLAARLGVTSPTIVQLVDDLHTAGLLHRDRNPTDRREHVLRLTSDGADYLADALRAEDAAQQALADALGEGPAAELNALLTAVITAR